MTQQVMIDTRPAPSRAADRTLYLLGLAALLAAPFFVYPLFLAKVLCYCQIGRAHV